MAFRLEPTKYFKKKYDKLIKNQKVLESKIRSILQKLSLNPNTSSLHSHKVNSPKFGNCFSSSITGDLRIIWQYNQNQEIEIIDLLDIGGHNEVY
jgi:mRNA-degrading endonuclease YafQ of YafQ-DinJ toxin-antitoxin module